MNRSLVTEVKLDCNILFFNWLYLCGFRLTGDGRVKYHYTLDRFFIRGSVIKPFCATNCGITFRKKGVAAMQMASVRWWQVSIGCGYGVLQVALQSEGWQHEAPK
ncbi:hypothetical protein H8744_09355 [Oscillospiraceae bacterium N12]|jgi:hypothetical protein|uniref:Uncharacterized protein n=1 Tax=Jilunia laotingensis TaxID=2763675 RepID=A0A926F0M0_9BACT|nr:hypothetical protein [Jilunia laotingensis]MBC8593448.1 hypothetical protein [Jilunia laotingensis]